MQISVIATYRLSILRAELLGRKLNEIQLNEIKRQIFKRSRVRRVNEDSLPAADRPIITTKLIFR